ncbi:MAG: hypothetical protein ABIM31_07290 [candidate division WOR-3 bacterium]
MIKKNRRSLLLRIILCGVIEIFILSQLPWTLREKEPVAFVLIALLSFLFLQYFLLNALYLVSNPEFKNQGEKYALRVGNLYVEFQPQDIIVYALNERRKYIMLKNCICTLEKYPLIARLLAKTPFLFAYTNLAFYSFPLFFSSIRDLERFYDFNKNSFGEKVVFSKELVEITGFNLPSLDRST